MRRECSAAIRAPLGRRDRRALFEIHRKYRPTSIHSLTAAEIHGEALLLVSHSPAALQGRITGVRHRWSARTRHPSGAFGPAAELGCQACDLAQLLGHFLESLRRLLSSHLRFGDPAGKNGVPLALGFQELLHFFRFSAAVLGVRQSTREFFHALLLP